MRRSYMEEIYDWRECRVSALDGLVRGEVDATASHTLRSRLASPKDELTLGKAWLAGFRAATTVAHDWVMGRRK